MATASALLGSTPTNLAWFVLLFAYCGLGVLVIGAVIVLTREERPTGGAPTLLALRTADPTSGGRHVAMSPLFLSISDRSVILDGVLEDESPVPVTIELVPPADEWLSLATVKVLERWIDNGEVIDIDLTKLHQPHGTVGLSCNDTRVRLDVLGLSRELDLAA